MKYLKTFEKSKEEKDYIKWKKSFTKDPPKFKIGDIVIYIGNEYEPEYRYFLENNIGKIKRMDTQKVHWYDVEYEVVPEQLEREFCSILDINDDSTTSTFRETEIRLATDEEIEEQKIKNELNNKLYKYNL